MKKPDKKLLALNIETLRDITGGFGGALGPLTVTLRTATVATRTIHVPTKDEVA